MTSSKVSAVMLGVAAVLRVAHPGLTEVVWNGLAGAAYTPGYRNGSVDV